MSIKKYIKNKNSILVLAIMFMAIIIRIMNYPNGIKDVNCDEVMMAINARSISSTAKDIYGTELPVYFEAWLNAGQSAFPTYLVALAIKLFGFNLFAIRLPILLISIISIYIIYLLSKKIFNDKIGILVLFLTAINPWHIMQSQWNLDCNLFPHIILIAVYFLYVGIVDKKKFFLFFSMFLFGISMYCYGISVYFVPLFLAIIGISLLLKKEIEIKEFIYCLLIYIIISLPIFIMYIINFLEIEVEKIKFGIFTIQKFQYDTRRGDMLIFSSNILQQLKINIISILFVILLQNDGLVWNSIREFGTIYLFSFPFIFIAVIGILTNKSSKNCKIILLWIVLSIIVGIFINKVNINRLNIIWYPLIMLTGYGIYEFCNRIKMKKIFFNIIILLYIIYFVWFITKFYGKFQDTISNAITFSNGLVDACYYINNMEEKNIIVSESSNTLKTYVYYRYALNYDYTIPIDKMELLYYYYFNKEMNWFNTDRKIFVTEDFSQEKLLQEEVYLIKTEEKKNINNIEEYSESIFGQYIILIKK